MNKKTNKHNRQSIRMQHYDYSTPGAYFVTINTHKREPLFGEIDNGIMVANEYGCIVHEWWHELPYRYENVRLDEFVIMPDHIHGIVVIEKAGDAVHVGAVHVGAVHELPQHELPVRLHRQEEYRKYRRKMQLPKMIGYLKMNAAKHINDVREVAGIPVWQRSYYERVVRNEHELNNIRRYIVNNPRAVGGRLGMSNQPY